MVGGWDEAGDVVQEAFARAWSRRDSYRGEGSLEAWVWRIALRIATRRAADARRREGAAAVDVPALPGETRAAKLTEAFAALPPGRRLLVVLRYVCGLSYLEIAEVTGLAEGTVAGALSKARKQLVAALEEKGVST
jgi:RNA polymerase sigma-70 factor, ECF subfamily